MQARNLFKMKYFYPKDQSLYLSILEWFGVELNSIWQLAHKQLIPIELQLPPKPLKDIPHIIDRKSSQKQLILLLLHLLTPYLLHPQTILTSLAHPHITDPVRLRRYIVREIPLTFSELNYEIVHSPLYHFMFIFVHFFIVSLWSLFNNLLKLFISLS